MSSPSHAADSPLTERQALVDYLAAGGRKKADWRIGTEHEKFGFHLDDLRPPTFDGERGIEALLKGLTRFGWAPVDEHGRVIALVRDGASVSLEPAGQFELSGAQLRTVHETCCEVDTHLLEVKAVADELGLGFLGMGFQPKWRRGEMPWMPKGRYKIKKFRVSLALQPIATALFADSPFTEGKPNGFLSYRSHIWTDTDAGRTGMLDFVFDDGFGYERYVDYLLDVPMYFSYRNGEYVDLAGQSFRKFMQGKLDALPGALPTLRDWSDHMTTAFPEVRLKQYLEMRGADGGPWNRLCALPAFWVGLLYDDVALDAAWDLVKDFSLVERHALRDGVPELALKLPFRGRSVRELALEALKISAHGLQRRAMTNGNGADESIFLTPLIDFAEANQTPAERKLALFHGEWNGDIDHVFREYAY